MGGVNRLAKLRAMTAREVASRVAYKARLARERAALRSGALAPEGRLRAALNPALRRSGAWQQTLARRHAAAGYFAGVSQQDAMRRVWEQRFGVEREKARRVAAEVLEGRIGFFGREFRFETFDWHADPVTGARWPSVFHADVPVNGGNTGYGDVKDVWELNRHQFFVDLAKIAFLDRSKPHADALHRLHADWTNAVPYATGAAWACALEPAFRAWSWLWAYHLVAAAGLVEEQDHLRWLTGFFDHGRFLYRHLETYSSPYNHLIGEASALFALGLLFPEFREAPAWTARGRDVLESTLGAQFHSDGGTVEQSTFYHHATLGFYLLSAILGRRHGVELSAAVWQAIERGIAFSAALVQPDGRIPRIGGADDGKPIRLEHLPFWDFRPYQAVGAVLFGRRDFRFVAERFWEDALWLLGPDAAVSFDQIDPQPPAASVALPASGYFVFRSGWDAGADYLLMDCGEQAAGLRRDDVPSAAHGHADCLSVVVALGGREVLVDPGFFCYNGDPAWEVHFRKTSAHNTVAVDGRDQARHISKMAWTRTYAAEPEQWAAERLGWMRGTHDGYARSADGVTHRRTAWLRPDGYVVLCDEIFGAPGHTAQAVFQFAPGDLALDGPCARFEGRFELSWSCSVPVTPGVQRGGEAPAAGWIATSLGVRAAAPRLSLSFRTTASRTVLLTILSDVTRCAHGAREAAPPAQSLHLRIAGEGFEDDVVAGVAGAASVGGVTTDAPLVIVRRVQGAVAEALHAGGSHISAQGLQAPSRHGAAKVAV